MQLVLKHIELEWKKEKKLTYKVSYICIKTIALPKKGMLASFHYHVGETQGVKKEHRHKILDQIAQLTRELPIITIMLERHIKKEHRPAYTLEWGEKNSCERLKKLSNSLSAFIYDAQTGYKKNLNFDMAIMDWSDDLDFLKENYYNALGCSYKWPDIVIKD